MTRPILQLMKLRREGFCSPWLEDETSQWRHRSIVTNRQQTNKQTGNRQIGNKQTNFPFSLGQRLFTQSLYSTLIKSVKSEVVSYFLCSVSLSLRVFPKFQGVKNVGQLALKWRGPLLWCYGGCFEVGWNISNSRLFPLSRASSSPPPSLHSRGWRIMFIKHQNEYQHLV